MTAIVMLHGWGMNFRVFDEIAAALAPRFEILAPDLPGYGDASPCEPYTLENLASRIALHAPQRCFVIGWSLGAEIALEWARTKPRQIARLALIGATPCFVQRTDWTCAMERTVFDAFYDACLHDSVPVLDRFVSLQAQGDTDARRVMRRLRAALSEYAASPPDVLQNGLRILRDSDLRSSLSGVPQPVLIVQGELDQLVPAAAGKYLARTLVDATLATIPDAAHAPFISQPQSVARMINEFFGGDEPTLETLRSAMNPRSKPYDRR